MIDGASFMENMQSYDMPARKAILQYLVRMGSFTSAPKILNEDEGDVDVHIPSVMTWNDLKDLCKEHLVDLPKPIPRSLGDPRNPQDKSIRIMQWNILGQGLADGCDVFVRCPKEALDWKIRRWRILEEIAAMQPDVLCMQEVDHFKFFERALGPLGYYGTFCPKPDSPCLYVPGNNGPDGCAIFINKFRFEVLETRNRILEICNCETNQVAIFCKIRRRCDGAELFVATTHLKAKSGAVMAELRREQGRDLVRYIESNIRKTPLLLCGDFNADPLEEVQHVLLAANLCSVYAGEVPAYTTWTVRDSGEYIKTLDYIFYSRNDFYVERMLRMPFQDEIGFRRIPSFTYPSDHFSLVADMVIYNH